MSVYVLATLDTKGAEAEFVRDILRDWNIEVRLVDTGCLGAPVAKADIDRAAVFAAGGHSLDEFITRGDRGEAVTAAAEGAAALIAQEHRAGRVDGVLALGGSAGTTIGCAAMRTLPLGVPKVMVSTLASGHVREWVRDKDIFMFNSVVDIAGLNRISRVVLHQAAAAMAGLVSHPAEAQRRATDESDSGGTHADRPLVAATMFGVTTPCVERARQVLEEAGYEVLVFHATGTGGQAMESLICEGLLAGVLDLTTTELADELVGGVLSAGPDRLTAAARLGIPQVVSVGATDMVNFGPESSIPEAFRGRTFYRHNENVTLMRTTETECRSLGEEIARKVLDSNGAVALVLPLRGVSAIDAEGQAFNDPVARESLFSAIRSHAAGVERLELDLHINDSAFAEAAANKLIELMQRNEAR